MKNEILSEEMLNDAQMKRVSGGNVKQSQGDHFIVKEEFASVGNFYTPFGAGKEKNTYKWDDKYISQPDAWISLTDPYKKYSKFE